MTIGLVVNGVTYQYPEEGDVNWGANATAWASAVTTGTLQKSGGNFTLTSDVNFGATYGLVSTYFKSRTANIATAGPVRLANDEGISWRNAANSANLVLKVDTSDQLEFNGNVIPTLTGLSPNQVVITDGSSNLDSEAQLAVSRGGTALSSVGTANQLLGANAGATAYEHKTISGSTGVSVSNGVGTITVSPANDLAAVEGIATTGLATRTASETWTTRTLVQPAAGITISNADGVSGNPTFALADDLANLEAQAGTGLAARIGTSSWSTTRQILMSGDGITITNGNGIAGNPTLSLNSDLAALEGLVTTGIARRTGTSTWTAGGTVSVGEGGTGQTSVTGAFNALAPTTTKGDLIVYNGGNIRLPVGSDNYVLTANSAAPNGVEWAPGTGALADPGSNGVLVRTALNTTTSRTITGPAAGITVSNGDGVSGNPTLALANDLAAVEGLASTGMAVRTGSDTWSTRTITGTTNQIGVTNGDGVSGNPTLVIANDVVLPGTGSVTIPSGTTAQRPGSPTNGMIRYNTTKFMPEQYTNGQWAEVGGGVNYTRFVEDFLSGLSTTSSGNNGSMGWQSLSGTGCSGGQTTSTANHPGNWQLICGTTAGQAFTMYLGNSTSSGSFGGTLVYMCIIAQISSANNSVQYMGFGNDPSNSSGVLGTDNLIVTRNLSPSRWDFTTRLGGTSTTVNGPTATAGTWYKFEFVWTGSGWEFFVDGTSYGTSTTNLPASTVITPVIRNQSAGQASTLTVDYFGFNYTTTR